MIFRNSFLSLSSMVIPLLVGLVTVPHIINDLGLQRFGVLTLIWAVIGYASLFDLGISMALTKRVAALQGQMPRLRSLVRSGLCLMSMFGVVMGLLALVVTRQFDYQRFGLGRDEFDQSVLLLAVSVPFVIVSGGFRGVLEGLHRFSVVSAVRLGFGLIIFIAPVFVLAHAPRIDYIIAIMLGARIIGTLVMAWCCRAYLPKGNVSRSRRRVELSNMLTFGGWITVSNLASALMLYMDRFFLGSSAFSSSLAFYTTTYEFVTKLFMLPSALSSVLLPYMARSSRFIGISNQLLVLGSALVLASVTPVVALIILFAPELLGWWISPEFGRAAAPALRILSIGVLVNCLAQIFRTYLLGRGKAAWTAKMHIVELVMFLPLLYFSIQYFGIEGAAWAWTLRILVDSIGMAFMLGKLKLPTSQHWWALTASFMVSYLIFACSGLEAYSKLALLAVLSILCTAGGLWSIRHWHALPTPQEIQSHPVSQRQSSHKIEQSVTHEQDYKSFISNRGVRKPSVIVVNWNGKQFLERCLVALMNQTLKPHEIILVDNASTDGSLEIARRFPSVRLLAKDSNTGFARGNNLAINAAAADSEWIALLNPDAFPEPRWLEECLLSAQRNPQFDIFGSKLLNASAPLLLDGAGDAYHVSGLVWRMGHGIPASAQHESEREVFSPCAAAALYRRSALLEVGGFDEDFFCYVEDVDLGFRLRLAGYRCLYVPKSVVHHVGSGTTGGQNSDFSVYHGHRNLVWTFVKDMPGLLFWLLLPLHLVLNLASIIWFTFRGQGRVILRAKRDALLGLPKMWRKRQQIQKSRIALISDIWRVLDNHLIPKIRKS